MRPKPILLYNPEAPDLSQADRSNVSIWISIGLPVIIFLDVSCLLGVLKAMVLQSSATERAGRMYL